MKTIDNKKLNWTFAVLLIIVVTIGFVTLQTFIVHRDYTLWVIHTHKVQERIESLLSHLKDAETGQRGYLITGDDSYLEPYTTSLQHNDRELSLLKKLTVDNRVQQKRFPDLESLIILKISELNETIHLRREEGFEASRDIVLTHQGKKTMDDIRTMLQSMKDDEQVLLASRTEKEEKTFYLYYFLAIVLFISLLLSFVYLRKCFKSKVKAETAFGSFHTEIEGVYKE